jgi:hypothetical protein
VELGQRRHVHVLRVVRHGEDSGASLTDALALEELWIDSSGVEDAGVGKFFGDLPRAPRVGFNEPYADALLHQEAGNGDSCLAGTEDDNVVDATLAVSKDPTPLACRGR